MIGYVTLGTNDLPRATKFYDAIAAEMGVGRMMDFDTFIAWGAWDGGAGIAATKPFDGKEATVGNGTMWPSKPRTRIRSIDCMTLQWRMAARTKARRAHAASRMRTARYSMPDISATQTATSSTLS